MNKQTANTLNLKSTDDFCNIAEIDDELRRKIWDTAAKNTWERLTSKEKNRIVRVKRAIIF